MKSPEEMHCDSITVKPIQQHWDYEKMREYDYTEDDAWEYWEAVQCEECEAWIVQTYYREEAHNDLDEDTDCEGYVPGSEGPMMNYWYPLTGEESFGQQADEEELALEIRHLPLCVVRVGGELGLALTGGGMDLSWEICEAYMCLGHLPPYHFCDLPAMSGRGESEGDRQIIAACKRTCEILSNWASRTTERLEDLTK